jgi:hypothetical protein
MFTIVDAIADSGAVRFIRFHTAEYRIDPNHIGISEFLPEDTIWLSPRMMTYRIRSKDRWTGFRRVQAAACFYHL